MYMESSSPVRSGQKARLISQTIEAGVRCFRFAYHMYGISTGKWWLFSN